ncbi:heavy-metal-associated domain-containing protein [Candidatus Uhrbacteria bacterium]|nr:heavy-metal-associated domain-containing protein [Candidatus Uhrbacteria bacterium]
MNELTFTISNLTCEACVKVTTMTLRKLAGVTDVSVDLSSGKTHIVSKEPINPDDVTNMLQAKGYTVAF